MAYIQMGISAASVAVLANNKMLTDVGAMQAAFYTLDASTINSSMKATSVQANADEAAIMDQAEVMKDQAIGGLTGAIGGFATQMGCLTYGGILNTQASALETPKTGLNVGLTEVTPAAPAPAAAPVAAATEESAVVVAETVAPAPVASSTGPSASVSGKFDTSGLDEETSAADAQKALNGKNNAAALDKESQTETENNTNMAKALRNKGELIMQNANTFGSLFNGVGQSGGSLAAYNPQADQAQQSKIKDLNSGLAGLLNSEAGLINQQISNLDQTRSATYQLMGTLQARQG